jgi:ketosteroid isomerase-like protein
MSESQGSPPAPELLRSDSRNRDRSQPDALIRRAEERDRLRGEIQSAAEREAREIIAAARRDVRRILLQARREVVTLNLQVQAALGSTWAPTSPTRARELNSMPAAGLPGAERNEREDVAAAARRDIHDVLEKARVELDEFYAIGRNARDGFWSSVAHAAVPSAASAPSPGDFSPPPAARERRGLAAAGLLVAGSIVLAASIWMAAGPSPVADASGPSPATDASGPGAGARQASVASAQRRAEPVSSTPSGHDNALQAPDVSKAPTSDATETPRPARLAPLQSTFVSEDHAENPGPAPQVPLRAIAVAEALRSTELKPASASGAVAGTTFSPPNPSATAPETVLPRPSEPAGDPQSAIALAGARWLDAYQRLDRSTMAAFATEDIVVLDERSPAERFPEGADVRRSLDQVQVQLAGNAGTLTAAMTEDATIAGQQQHISRVSQTWLQQDGDWRLIQVRIISEARLRQFAR